MMQVGSLSDLHTAKVQVDDADSTASSEVSTYGKKRWAILAIFSLATLLESLNGTLYPPVAIEFMELWGVTFNLINLITIISLVVPFVFYFYFMWFADCHHLEPCFYLAVLVNILCSWLRYFLPQDGLTGYYIALGTQVIISLTHPAIVVLPPRLSKKYFPLKERGLATAIGTVCGQLGLGLGMIVSPLFSTNLSNLYLFHSVASTIPVLFSFLVFDVRKIFDLSRVEEDYDAKYHTKELTKESFWATLKRIGCNWPFIHILTATAVVVGCVQSWISLIRVAAQPSFASAESASIIAALFFGFGLLGAIGCGFAMDYFKDYVYVARWMVAFSYPTAVVAMVGWHLDIAMMVYIGMGLSALGGFGFLALAIELSIEYTYLPGVSSEGAICGIVHIATNVMASIFIVISTPGNIFTSASVPLFWLGIYSICAVALFLLPKKYNRMEALEDMENMSSLEDGKSVILEKTGGVDTPEVQAATEDIALE